MGCVVSEGKRPKGKVEAKDGRHGNGGDVTARVTEHVFKHLFAGRHSLSETFGLHRPCERVVEVLGAVTAAASSIFVSNRQESE